MKSPPRVVIIRFPGFTLVELMVVMVIVVMLVGVMLLMVQKGIRQAEMGTSISNLRQLSMANLSYVGDYGTYAPATSRRNRIRWHGGRASAREPFDPKLGYLSPYLGSSARVGQCPGLKRHLEGGTSWEDGSGGYGYNAAYIGGMPKDSFRPNRPANVPNPGRTLMFATTAFSKSEGLQEYPFAEPRFWLDPNGNFGGPLQASVHFRFNDRALIAWCDGHVSAEPMEDSSVENYYGGDNEAAGIGFPGPSEQNGWWNPMPLDVFW